MLGCGQRLSVCGGARHLDRILRYSVRLTFRSLCEYDQNPEQVGVPIRTPRYPQHRVTLECCHEEGSRREVLQFNGALCFVKPSMPINVADGRKSFLFQRLRTRPCMGAGSCTCRRLSTFGFHAAGVRQDHCEGSNEGSRPGSRSPATNCIV